MRIGIDGIPLNSSPTGIGKYLIELIYVIQRTLPFAEIFVFSNKEVFLPDDLQHNVNVVLPHNLERHLKPIIWLKFFAFFKLRKYRLDFYISSMGFLPFLESKTKSMSIVHDLNYVYAPSTMSRLHFFSHLFFLKKDVRKANYVITNSIGTANKVKKHFAKDASFILNPPISKSYYQFDKNKTNEILQKYGIDFPYFLSVGTLEPRKNTVLSIKALHYLNTEGRLGNYRLVLVGAKGWRSGDILDLCEESEGFIKMLGYVDEADMPYLYYGAKAFLFPSLYEGFGIPVREAMICGTTVVTTDIEELREASCNQAIWVDPYNTIQYADCIESLMHNRYNSLNEADFDSAANEENVSTFFKSLAYADSTEYKG